MKLFFYMIMVLSCAWGMDFSPLTMTVLDNSPTDKSSESPEERKKAFLEAIADSERDLREKLITQQRLLLDKGERMVPSSIEAKGVGETRWMSELVLPFTITAPKGYFFIRGMYERGGYGLLEVRDSEGKYLGDFVIDHGDAERSFICSSTMISPDTMEVDMRASLDCYARFYQTEPIKNKSLNVKGFVCCPVAQGKKLSPSFDLDLKTGATVSDGDVSVVVENVEEQNEMKKVSVVISSPWASIEALYNGHPVTNIDPEGAVKINCHEKIVESKHSFRVPTKTTKVNWQFIAYVGIKLANMPVNYQVGLGKLNVAENINVRNDIKVKKAKCTSAWGSRFELDLSYSLPEGYYWVSNHEESVLCATDDLERKYIFSPSRETRGTCWENQHAETLVAKSLHIQGDQLCYVSRGHKLSSPTVITVTKPNKYWVTPDGYKVRVSSVYHTRIEDGQRKVVLDIYDLPRELFHGVIIKDERGQVLDQVEVKHQYSAANSLKAEISFVIPEKDEAVSVQIEMNENVELVKFPVDITVAIPKDEENEQ